MPTKLDVSGMGHIDREESICVVVPVYNVAQYLQRCVDSLTNQVRLADEIILVDDGSTDGSSELCDLIADRNDRFRVIHQINGGLSAARNTGIRESHCDLITFVDSDDWVSPRFLECLYTLHKETSADIAMCGMRRASSLEDFNNHALLNGCKRTYTGHEFIDMLLRIKQNRCVHYACAKLFSMHTMCDEQFPVGMLNEDVEGTYKAALKASIVSETEDELYCYFVNPESITGSKFGKNYLNLVDVWTRVLNYTRIHAPEYIADVLTNVKRSDFTILCDSLIHGDRKTDIRYQSELNLSLTRLRHNTISLLTSRIVFSRKVAILAVSLFYKPIRLCWRFGHRRWFNGR